MVKRAVALIKAKGKEEAFAEINNLKGAFIDRDLYVSVLDEKGVMLATGGNARLINKDLIDLKDTDGKFIIKEHIDMAQKRGSGWIHYKWINPTTKAIQSKSTYVEKLEDLIITCGIYK